MSRSTDRNDRSSLMNYANRSDSPYSITSIVNGNLTFNVSGCNFFAPIINIINIFFCYIFHVAEASHHIFLIFHCLTLTGKCINEHDNDDDMMIWWWQWWWYHDDMMRIRWWYDDDVMIMVMVWWWYDDDMMMIW